MDPLFQLAGILALVCFILLQPLLNLLEQGLRAAGYPPPTWKS